jgi:hypothetical protein
VEGDEGVGAEGLRHPPGTVQDGGAPSDSRPPPALDEEPTLVEALASVRSEVPPHRDAMAPPASFDDPEEHTLVDVIRSDLPQ